MFSAGVRLKPAKAYGAIPPKNPLTPSPIDPDRLTANLAWLSESLDRLADSLDLLAQAVAAIPPEARQ